MIGSGCRIASDATIGGRTVLGAGVWVGPGAHVDSSVLLDGARIGARSRVSRSDRRPRRADRRALSRRRGSGTRRGGARGGGQRAHRGDPYLPRCGAPRRRGRVLTATTPASDPPADLGPESVQTFDSSGQFADVLGLSEHLGDALWRVESASIEPQDSPGGLVVAGMGGSAIGGLLARAVLGDRASRRISVSRDYGLPAWTTPDTTVLCSSYSGDDRGDAGGIRRGGGARRPADRVHDRRPLGRARP